MTNGKMEESLQKQATLKDVEPEVFAQLANFAYHGLCAVSDGVSTTNVNAKASDKVQASVIRHFRCIACGRTPTQGIYPFCGPSCKDIFGDAVRIFRENQSMPNTIHCVKCGGLFDSRLADTDNISVLCNAHNRSEDDGKHPPIHRTTFQPLTTSSTQMTCGGAFSKRQYGCTSLSSEALSTQIKAHRQVHTPVWPLIQHAKIYVVSTKYMVKDLPDICLHKLHRALTVLGNDDVSNEQLIDLVLYIYANTFDEGSVLQGTADKLRDLVMAFIVDRAKSLMKYENFRSMLSAGGQQTSDFMTLTYA